MNFLALNYALHSSAMSVGCGEMMSRSLLFEKHSWKVLRHSETVMFVRPRLLSDSIRRQFFSNIFVGFSGDGLMERGVKSLDVMFLFRGVLPILANCLRRPLSCCFHTTLSPIALSNAIQRFWIDCTRHVIT